MVRIGEINGFAVSLPAFFELPGTIVLLIIVVMILIPLERAPILQQIITLDLHCGHLRRNPAHSPAFRYSDGPAGSAIIRAAPAR